MVLQSLLLPGPWLLMALHHCLLAKFASLLQSLTLEARLKP